MSRAGPFVNANQAQGAVEEQEVMSQAHLALFSYLSAYFCKYEHAQVVHVSVWKTYRGS